MLIFSPPSRSSTKRGFTLVELLVVVSIMVVITGVMLFKQAKFDSSTLLRSLAYSVALSVRQAQVYGTSVLGTTVSQGACSGFYASGVCYATGYGIYLSGGTLGQYTLFADLDSNGRYDNGEMVKVFTLGSSYAINQFCVTGVNGGATVTRCSPSTINSLSILFKRPNPDALFYADFNGTPIAGDTYASANIQIQNLSDTASTRNVTVTNTGLISTQ